MIALPPWCGWNWGCCCDLMKETLLVKRHLKIGIPNFNLGILHVLFFPSAIFASAKFTHFIFVVFNSSHPLLTEIPHGCIGVSLSFIVHLNVRVALLVSPKFKVHCASQNVLFFLCIWALLFYEFVTSFDFNIDACITILIGSSTWLQRCQLQQRRKGLLLAWLGSWFCTWWRPWPKKTYWGLLKGEIWESFKLSTSASCVVSFDIIQDMNCRWHAFYHLLLFGFNLLKLLSLCSLCAFYDQEDQRKKEEKNKEIANIMSDGMMMKDLYYSTIKRSHVKSLSG